MRACFSNERRDHTIAVIALTDAVVPAKALIASKVVIPAKAGIHFGGLFAPEGQWIPAFAGMTALGVSGWIGP